MFFLFLTYLGRLFKKYCKFMSFFVLHKESDLILFDIISLIIAAINLKAYFIRFIFFKFGKKEV